MARTLLPASNPTGAYPVVAGWLEFTPGDASNGNSVTLGARYVVYAKNTDSVNQTILIKSVADPQGRLDDNTIVIPAGAILRIDGITNTGFAQEDRTFWIDVSSATVELAVWKLDR